MGYTWQFVAAITFPLMVSIPVDEAGQPLAGERRQTHSRIPVGSRSLDHSTKVFIRQGNKEHFPQLEGSFGYSVAELVVRIDTDASSANDASLAVTPTLDRVIESLSFQLQEPLHMLGLRVIDLSGEVAVGDVRTYQQWTDFSTPTFRPPGVPMEALVGRDVPSLSLDLDPTDSRANRALDWYLKSMTAAYEVDQFIFLWISSEILAAGNSDKSLEMPYQARCGHLIENCPVCSKPTARVPQGKAMQAWLSANSNITPDSARDIWIARQILHGAHAFDSGVVSKLPHLIQQLRSVIVAVLKDRLGIPAEQPPFAAPEGLTLARGFALAGTTAVTPSDLDPLSPAESS